MSVLPALIVAACTKSNPTSPTPVPLPTDPPKITCPAPQAVTSAIGQLNVTVTYPGPTISGGASPMSVKCSPPTASSFDLGSTAVKCMVTDAQQRADSCTFSVNVAPAPIPRLSVTTLVAFGDSMTEGSNVLLPQAVPIPPGSYPGNLAALLVARYTTQTFTVLDEGVPGETVENGRLRLPRVLSSDRPGALLLLEGVNDLNGLGASAIPSVTSSLQGMVRAARASGAVVFWATLPPQRPGGSRAFAPTLIEPLNERIRALAPTEGAVLVDLYRDFNGEVNQLLQSDGLHPNAAGYQRMAQSFFTAIRGRLEVITPTPLIVTTGRAVDHTAWAAVAAGRRGANLR